MKILLFFAAMFVIMVSCNSSQQVASANKMTSANLGDTIRIANDELEYEVIIIDPGFSTWMMTHGKPRGHYSQGYMESRNRIWVNEWNTRALDSRYANLFQMPIDYRNNIDYGYEVNYLLYNYLTYFQLQNNVRLSGYVPRI